MHAGKGKASRIQQRQNTNIKFDTRSKRACLFLRFGWYAQDFFFSVWVFSCLVLVDPASTRAASGGFAQRFCSNKLLTGKLSAKIDIRKEKNSFNFSSVSGFHCFVDFCFYNDCVFSTDLCFVVIISVDIAFSYL